MASIFRSAVVLGLVAGLGSAVDAQGERCTTSRLTIDGTPILARFCIPAGPPGTSVTVTESFSAGGKATSKTLAFPINPDAKTSRTGDIVELDALGFKRSLHLTLMYRGAAVELEHALELPGAIPLK